MSPLLIVDDEPALAESLRKVFEREKIETQIASSGEAALAALGQRRFEVVLTDLRMARLTGIDLLKIIHREYPETLVIVMTAYATIDTAIEAMKEGAHDFITKPFRKAIVTRAVRRALEQQALLKENRSLKEALADGNETPPLIGEHPEFRRLLEKADQIAATRATVLLRGESGTGKELFARRLHRKSAAAAKPIVVINCAAIPEQLFESELFGHERGAFTGATQSRSGSFMQADGGTLFLDEVAELPLTIQAKLLRALQQGEIQPVGGPARHVDVRLIAATNQDLEAMVKAGRFREDLYYRLNVVQLRMVPLRERKEDIPLLAQAFLLRTEKRAAHRGYRLSEATLQTLSRYDFPGNVRQLENAIEYAVLLAPSLTIEPGDLPPPLSDKPAPEAPPQSPATLSFPVGTPLEEMERRAIKETLCSTRGDKELAAKLLGISVRTIYRKLGIEEV